MILVLAPGDVPFDPLVLLSFNSVSNSVLLIVIKRSSCR